MDARQLGIYGELVAARFLRRHGYEVLQSNFHSRFGEIDLIVSRDDTIVFVEVKTRDVGSITRPAEAVTFSKQQKIKSTSLLYLSRFEKEVNVRYDVVEVIAVTKGDKKIKIHHIMNAFE